MSTSTILIGWGKVIVNWFRKLPPRRSDDYSGRSAASDDYFDRVIPSLVVI